MVKIVPLRHKGFNRFVQITIPFAKRFLGSGQIKQSSQAKSIHIFEDNPFVNYEGNLLCH